MDPANRKTILLARWFECGTGSPNPTASQASEAYSEAYLSVDSGASEDLQKYNIRLAVEHDLRLKREELEERETLKKLDRRVENVEVLLGKVLERLADDDQAGS